MGTTGRGCQLDAKHSKLDAASLAGAQDDHQTRGSGEFDADLIVFVSAIDGWSAAKYIDELHSAFRENGTYKDKVRRFFHCVTITYAIARKIDVAPSVVNQGGLTRLEVCNREAEDFEKSEPRQYSVLLTTILGYRITSIDKDSEAFTDGPSALKTIFGRLDDWLQLNASKPSVSTKEARFSDHAAL
jgi:hypothetical protein